MSQRFSVEVGTTFTAQHESARGHRLWRVTEAAGPDSWRAACDVTRAAVVFTAMEIHKALFRRECERIDAADPDEFYASQDVGTVLHARSLTDGFLRGRIVDVDGKHMFQPEELVGAWHANDLPSRRADGSVHNGWAADYLNEPPLRMRVSQFWEVLNEGEDPRELPPLNLDVPEPAAAEAADHERFRRLERIVQVAQDPRMSTADRLREIRNLVAHSER